MWQTRTSVLGAPWEAPLQTTDVPPRVTFTEEEAEQVRQFAEAVQNAGASARGRKLYQEDVYQGRGKVVEHVDGRSIWKAWVPKEFKRWQVADTLDRVMQDNGYDLKSLMQFSNNRQVRSDDTYMSRN